MKDKCNTCGERYSQPPTDRAMVCSSGFHCCRDCVWSAGRRIRRCIKCASEERASKSKRLNDE